MAGETVTPYPLAMVVCDTIWTDPYTGKQTIIGTFTALGGSSFPLVHPILSVYVALTDGRGKMQIQLELVDVDEQRDPIFEDDCEIEFTDPRMIHEMGFMVTGLQFPEPGEYRLKLSANGEFVIERRILVIGPQEEDTNE